MTQLRIVTFNTWNCQGSLDRRLALMSAGLKAVDADAILLQEVFWEPPTGLNVAGRLADSLGMDVAFVPARKKLRTMNGSPVLGFSGLAVLTREPIQGGEQIRLPEDPRDGERMGQLVTATIKGLDVVFANVHLSHLPNEDGLRQRQLDTVAAALDSFAGCDVTVLGGDMNLEHGHGLLENLKNDHGFQCAAYDVLPKSTLNPVDAESPSLGVVDHLFVRAGRVAPLRISARTALSHKDVTCEYYPSDHMAVVANIDVE